MTTLETTQDRTTPIKQSRKRFRRWCHVTSETL